MSTGFRKPHFPDEEFVKGVPGTGAQWLGFVFLERLGGGEDREGEGM